MADKKKYYELTSVNEIKAILKKISLFGGLTEKQLKTVYKLLKGVRYKKDDIIFKQGDDPRFLYIIKSGEIRIVVNIDTEPLELADFREGACIGEMALIGIQPHSATAVAIVDTEFMVLSSDALYSIHTTDKELFSLLILNLAREACRRLHKADEVMLHYVHNQR
ncbi:MAG: cyclic nucleotide-binding domain-containing protein [Candidatus Omnitrophica bacterium]|nr:cyclic nucleotide-binding domain-containing protein [Candidatus Omnitrophota bacterium]